MEVQMGGELVACVRMSTSQLVVKERRLDLDPSDLWVTSSTLPGVTWNLNQRNNQMCSWLANSNNNY